MMELFNGLHYLAVHPLWTSDWWCGIAVRHLSRINEVTLHWAWLVPECMTLCGPVNHLGMQLAS